MAGDDILAEAEPERLNRMDRVLKRLVDVKVLDRKGPGAIEQCQYLEKHIVDTQDKGLHQRAVVSWTTCGKIRSSKIAEP